MNDKKAPGFDQITGQISNYIARKEIAMFTYLINAAVRHKHVPGIW